MYNQKLELESELNMFRDMFFLFATKIVMEKQSNSSFRYRDLGYHTIVKIFTDRLEFPSSNSNDNCIKIYYENQKMLKIVKLFPKIINLEIYTKLTDLSFIDKLEIKCIRLENTNLTVDDLKKFPNLERISHDSSFQYEGDIKKYWSNNKITIERI